MSVSKAVSLLGIGRDNLRLIPVDEDFRMLPEALEQSMRKDKELGITPMAVVATAGTVNTGATDPLADSAKIAGNHRAWLHVDGSYGALAAIAIPEKFLGLARADSLALDPHKWFYQPLDCGCLLHRHSLAARAAFAHSADYVRPLDEGRIESHAYSITATGATLNGSMGAGKRLRARRSFCEDLFGGGRKIVHVAEKCHRLPNLLRS